MPEDSAADPVVDYLSRIAVDTAGPDLNTPAQQYRLLREGLLSGEVPPGALLLESTISRCTGASRTPVRQALTRLEHDGFLVRQPRGWRVKIGSPEEIIEIYETRIVLEAFAARLAARHRTELDLARLRNLHGTASAQTADGGAAHEANRSWHDNLWAASRNETVRALLHRLSAQLKVLEVANLAAADNLERTAVEHARILQAIEARDEHAAAAAITEHLDRTLAVRVAYFATGATAPALA